MTRAREAFGSLPLLFVENHGQTDPRVTHYIQAGAASVFFAPRTITHLLRAPAEAAPADRPDDGEPPLLAAGLDSPLRLAAPRPQGHWAVEMELVGADPAVQPRGMTAAPTVVSYFKGQEAGWKTGLPTSTGLVYPELWPGIDLVYESAAGRLKSSFVVHPGADPGRIVLAYRGATSVDLDESGALAVSTPIGGFRETAPVAFQDRDGERTVVGAGFQVVAAPDLDATIVSFAVGAYDPGLPLVIDPVTLYTRSIDGPGFDAILSVKVDGAGNAYIVGYTEGLPTNVPVAGPDTTFNGSQDAIVGKLNPAGSAFIYLGYIGSNGVDQAVAVAVDPANRAYVLGQTDALPAPGTPNGFPVKVGPDLTYGGSKDTFIARVNAAGTGLDYAGYIGGEGQDDPGHIAVDTAFNAYVVGSTTSTRAGGFPSKFGPNPDPSKDALHLDRAGGTDGFVAKVQSDGSAFVYAGFVGTTADDILTDVAVDTAGNAYLVGSSQGMHLDVGRTDSEVRLLKLNAAGTSFPYNVFWGGTNNEIPYGVAIDAAGNAYLAGYTASINFPVTVAGSRLRGEFDAFVTKINPQTNQYAYSRYIGGDAVDVASGIAVDGAQNAYIAGATFSTPAQGFPIFGGPNTTFHGFLDGFIVKVLANGVDLGYGTYFGGGPNTPGDQLASVAVDQSGNAYAAGLVVDSFDVTSNQPGVSGFVGKIGEAPAAAIPCAPRPPVRVSTVQTGSGQLQVTISAGTSAGTPANALRELRFGAARNAMFDVTGGPVGQTGPYTHTLLGRPLEATFVVRRLGIGAFMVPLDVIDDCVTPWKTFVGGGASLP